MNSNKIRKAFLDFFSSKQHQIISSAPMVIKNDPSLMFTNAGMNQFKDIFLDNSPVKYNRIANSQKCLRVSGKHNDLEQVGHDTYHHTMFEMLGNWSFGDYFKKEAIMWAYEFLVDVLKISEDRLYATVLDESENIKADNEAYKYWAEIIAQERIIYGSIKDNFWEMGDTGPCGPCSEIHIDIRDDKERKKIDGKNLINKDHPQVIEIWNLVFIQYNRKANGTLENLQQKHIDTGLGFERLCMVVQNKQSNYYTDLFQPLIQEIEIISSQKYGNNKNVNIAMRVIADHLRAVAFAIADGQLPSNNKAGYVIRRILRRAIRYGYTFLNLNEPFINKLVPVLVNTMADAYPELKSQQQLIQNVIREEELAFLRTLHTGINLLDGIINKTKDKKNTVPDFAEATSGKISGKIAFELYDTYGFPLDLTELILKENNLTVNKEEFDKDMLAQKTRSYDAASIETEDWVELKSIKESEFVGYENLEYNVKIAKYRKIKLKGKDTFQIVLAQTPFYAESGGQVGDNGYLISKMNKIKIYDTQKESNLIIHYTNELPAPPKSSPKGRTSYLSQTFVAKVDVEKRILTENNHSATHLLHSALKQVLGNHVEQKGSFVNSEYLRFDFSHFRKVTDEELASIEMIVNKKIRENISQTEYSNIRFEEARKMGAIALFGEKYEEKVRIIIFDKDFSVELCGGTHVKATGQIGFFKIISESAIAAGIRRIEAITASKAEQYVNDQLHIIKDIKNLLKNPKDISKTVENLLNENIALNKQIDTFSKEKLKNLTNELINKIQVVSGINLIAENITVDSADTVKDLAFQLKNKVNNLFLVLGAEINRKASLTIMISENLVKDKKLNANTIIREIAKEINGGGGGQDFYATAGGKNPEGLTKAIERVKKILKISR